MFLVVNKNKKTGAISVLDTDDMKVDIFEPDELQNLVNKYGLKIAGYPSSRNGIWFKNTYSGRNFAVWFGYDKSNSSNYVLSMQGLKSFGELDWKTKTSNAEIFSTLESLNSALYVENMSGLQKLLSLYIISLRYTNKKTFLIEMLYDVYTGTFNTVLTHSKNAEEIWGSSYTELLSQINFIEYSGVVYFFDNDIVLGVKKETFDGVGKAKIYNTKAVTLGSKVRMDSVTNRVKLCSCNDLVMRKGYTYELVKPTQIDKLEIRKGANFVSKAKKYKLDIVHLKCEDLECFKKLIGHADFYNLSVPLSHLVVLIKQYQYWGSCDFTITDIDCPVSDLVDAVNNYVGDIISVKTYNHLSFLEDKLNVDLLSRYSIQMTRTDYISLFYQLYGVELHDFIIEMSESDEVVEHIQTRLLIFLIKYLRYDATISTNGYNVYMKKLCYDDEVRTLKSDKCRNETNGIICRCIEYLYDLSKRYGFKYAVQKNRAETVRRLCINSLDFISQNYRGSYLMDIPINSIYISVIDSVIKDFENFNKLRSNMSISVMVNIKDKKIYGVNEPNLNEFIGLCKQHNLFCDFNFKGTI